MKHQPFETRAHDLTGYAALNFLDGRFASFAQVFARFDPARHEPVTLKISLEAGRFTLTLYARDRLQAPPPNPSGKKLLVQKFKLVLTADAFSRHISRFAVALSNEKFNIEEMEVIPS
ncbi:hypothetical protein E4631_20175 [Hymenobacter sp. UV11]|uniref:hypothetical protein n=1 Tax=Hymenobacter sp. UV11 TaxID=1849735 RepID=UPI00105BF2EB|nr:hypothetical protein [Hymenobacter sp. UV11]TDN36928.1 hypothetical protein A8B98_05900 [Hymenobacter sp. UV11]TFZ64317.1 hypothetical protein E4631_20175 [Hymenobacter sp. UV11]